MRFSGQLGLGQRLAVAVGKDNTELADALRARYYPQYHMMVDEDAPGGCDGRALSPIGFAVMTPSSDNLRWGFNYYEHENLPLRDDAEYAAMASGNIMIDSYEMLRSKIRGEPVTRELGLSPGAFGVVTLHRPSNVDDREALAALEPQGARADALRRVAEANRAVRNAQYQWDNFTIPSDQEDLTAMEAISVTLQKLEKARADFEPSLDCTGTCGRLIRRGPAL